MSQNIIINNPNNMNTSIYQFAYENNMLHNKNMKLRKTEITNLRYHNIADTYSLPIIYPGNVFTFW